MSQGLIQYAILLPALYIGLRASIEDTRLGKIYNHHIFLGLVAGLVWYGLLLVFYGGLFADWSVLTDFFPRLLAASLAGFALAAGMWWANVWSGGDAKLFTVFVFLSPPSLYLHSRADYLAPFVVLVNTYTVAFVLITLDFLVRLTRRISARLGAFRGADAAGRQAQLRGFVRLAAASWPGLLKTFLGLMFILVLVRLLRSLVRGQLEGVFHLDDTLLFLLLFLAFRPLHRLFQYRAVLAAAVLGLGAYVGKLLYDDPSGQSLNAVAGIGLIAFSLILFRQLYVYWSSLVEVTRIPLAELKPHMILSQNTRNDLVAKALFTPEEMKQLGVEGLSVEYAHRTKTLYRSEIDPETVEIEKTIPFAPFIFLGFLATLLTHDVLVRF